MRRAAIAPGLILCALLVACVVLLTSLSAARPTLALFSDSSTVTTRSLASGSVTKPEASGCTVANPLVGTKSLTTTWTGSQTPPILTYTARLRETGDVLSISTSGSQRSVRVTGNLLESLFGNTFQIDVTASLPGTSWTATSTRTGTLGLLGLGFSCGAWA